MTYTSFNYFVFMLLVGLFYFLLPKKYRYILLGLSSGIFIFKAGGKSSLFFIYGTAFLAYVAAVLLDKNRKRKAGKWILALSVAVVLSILFLLKYKQYYNGFFSADVLSIAIPIGISFYTLQIIAYIIDVYRGTITFEKNILKFLLYVTWFPHILQGPIARYNELSKTLYEGTGFEYDRVCKGIQLALWGVAEKLIVADRAYLVVNEVFTNYGKYGSVEIIFASVLYAVQLYADFDGCVNISRGFSQIFGVELSLNFEQPYFATSIKDFWRRWHLSLSSWLRDYVYIPLGGNRKGIIRKYINIMITFLISGIWHGAGNHFIFWGLLHGVYQVFGDLTRKFRESVLRFLHISNESKILKVWKCFVTFLLVDIAWVFFRADSFMYAVNFLKTAATKWNFWVLFNEGLYQIGLDRKEMWLLLFGILVIFLVDYLHEKKIQIREMVSNYSQPVRWVLYLGLIFAILIFGKYGYGFDAKDFIYMQF